MTPGVLDHESLQCLLGTLLIYTPQCIFAILPTYLLVQCANKRERNKMNKTLGKQASKTNTTSGKAPMSDATHEPKEDKKSQEKLDPAKGDQKVPEEPKVEKQEPPKEDVKSKSEEKKEEKKKEELKPKVIKRNEKEERIAQGKEVRNKGDYPTFNDVESDWDSDKDKKDKKGEKGEKGEKDEKKNEKKAEENKEDKEKKPTSLQKTQSLSKNDAAAAPAKPTAKPATLSVEPTQAKVAASGGVWKHQLTNPSNKRFMFKVRCSNNNQYRVHPVFGFVDASATTGIEVTRLKGSPQEDKLVVQYAPAPANATDAQTAFAEQTPAGNLTILLSAS
ncbi:hypothetical protein Q1695_006283 [Nippostrongylus brasiliensis]|nr:hypothetical protein Q1695_006283 [Nippostrongylus brasiliensis]